MLVPIFWWTEVSRGVNKEIVPEFGARLGDILFDVSDLHQFPKTRDRPPVGKAVGGVHFGGVLRVLAIIGGDDKTILQTFKRAEHQESFPLATLRLKGVKEMLGASMFAKLGGW